MKRKGLVHIYTGDGKGKTSAAVGLAVRARGAGMKVLIVQFLKGMDTSEIKPLEDIGIKVVRNNAIKKFVPQMDSEELKACREIQLCCFRAALDSLGAYDLIVLDEIFGAIQCRMMGEDLVENLIKEKPADLELVLTGRGAPEKLICLADYVSEIKAVKHPFDKGICSRRGIEY